MNTERIVNLRSAPTSRTLAILSCALALLTVSPAGPARNLSNHAAANTQVRTASSPQQSPAWRMASGTMVPTARHLANTRDQSLQQQTDQTRAARQQWQTTLLCMQTYLLTALVTLPERPTEYLIEVPSVLQIALPASQRTITSAVVCIYPPPPPVERWFALTHCLLAPPHHA